MSQTPNLNREWFAAKKRASVAFESGDALGMVEAETTAALFSRKGDLVQHATRLAQRLLAVAERVEAEPENHYSLNSAGEAQGAGADVDRLCAEIGVLRDVLAGVASVRKGEQ
jgi:hypothetical protein